MNVASLLTDPRTFFAERADDPSLAGPVLVVAVLGVVSALSTVPSARATMTAMPDEAQAFGNVALAVGAVVAFVATFVFWLVYAGVFHAVSAVAFDGDGEFTDTLAVTGWGNVPQILGSVVTAGATFLVYSDVDLSAVRDDPQRMQETLQTVQNDPILIAATLVGIALTLWSGALWTFGVAEVRDVELREAAISVGVVVVLAVGFSAWGLVGAF